MPGGDELGLAAYRRNKLDLADLLRAGLHAARSRRDDQLEDDFRRLLARVAEDSFVLAVAGQFSRGKSSLMNAVFGAPHLPVGALPMTSVVTTVRYGERPVARVRRRRSPIPIETPLDDLARFVSQSSVSRSELEVISADVELPAEILRLGFTFVDTPGIGSSIQANTATTKRFLPDADAVVFVTSFDSPLTGAEIDFLAEVRRHVDKLFLVVNKQDLVSDKEADEVLNFVRRRLQDELQLAQVRLFPVSARQALDGRARGDQACLAKSGLLSLEAELVRFLTDEKTGLFLQRCAERATPLVAQLRTDLALGSLDDESKSTISRGFEDRLGTLQAGHEQAAAEMVGRVQTEVAHMLDDRQAGWQAELRSLADPAVQAATARSDAAELADPAADRTAAEALGRHLNQIFHDWLSQQAALLRESLVAVTSNELDTLFHLGRAPFQEGVRLAGLEDEIEDPWKEAEWAGTDLPTVALPTVTLVWSADLPRRASRFIRTNRTNNALYQQFGDLTNSAITTYCAQAAQAILAGAGKWADQLVEATERGLRDSAARFLHQLRTPPTQEDRTAVEDLAGRLGDLKAAVFDASKSSTRPARPTGSSPSETAQEDLTRPIPLGRPGCTVCDRMAARLGEVLRHDQHQLAVSQRRQARHAKTGGFCALHTWEYAGLAAPVDISASHAALADSIARVLEDAVRKARTAPDLARALAGLDRNKLNCPICAVLQETEERAVADTARLLERGEQTSPLCLHHLSVLIDNHLQLEVARPLVEQTATTLRQSSEDMRLYALKREALHRELLISNEEQSHLVILHFLAGHPALARVPPPQDEI